jgi:N6-adenosine-specific RNA methylase IME4
MMFDDLPRKHYAAVLADPPWRFKAWSGKGTARAADNHYRTMTVEEMCSIPVAEVVTDDCALFLWCCWPTLFDAMKLIDAWRFGY